MVQDIRGETGFSCSVTQSWSSMSASTGQDGHPAVKEKAKKKVLPRFAEGVVSVPSELRSPDSAGFFVFTGALSRWEVRATASALSGAFMLPGNISLISLRSKCPLQNKFGSVLCRCCMSLIWCPDHQIIQKIFKIQFRVKSRQRRERLWQGDTWRGREREKQWKDDCRSHSKSTQAGQWCVSAMIVIFRLLALGKAARADRAQIVRPIVSCPPRSEEKSLHL